MMVGFLKRTRGKQKIPNIMAEPIPLTPIDPASQPVRSQGPAQSTLFVLTPSVLRELAHYMTKCATGEPGLSQLLKKARSQIIETSDIVIPAVQATGSNVEGILELFKRFLILSQDRDDMFPTFAESLANLANWLEEVASWFLERWPEETSECVFNGEDADKENWLKHLTEINEVLRYIQELTGMIGGEGSEIGSYAKIQQIGKNELDTLTRKLEAADRAMARRMWLSSNQFLFQQTKLARLNQLRATPLLSNLFLPVDELHNSKTWKVSHGYNGGGIQGNENSHLPRQVHAIINWVRQAPSIVQHLGLVGNGGYGKSTQACTLYDVAQFEGHTTIFYSFRSDFKASMQWNGLYASLCYQLATCDAGHQALKILEGLAGGTPLWQMGEKGPETLATCIKKVYAQLRQNEKRRDERRRRYSHLHHVIDPRSDHESKAMKEGTAAPLPILVIIDGLDVCIDSSREEVEARGHQLQEFANFLDSQHNTAIGTDPWRQIVKFVTFTRPELGPSTPLPIAFGRVAERPGWSETWSITARDNMRGTEEYLNHQISPRLLSYNKARPPESQQSEEQLRQCVAAFNTYAQGNWLLVVTLSDILITWFVDADVVPSDSLQKVRTFEAKNASQTFLRDPAILICGSTAHKEFLASLQTTFTEEKLKILWLSRLWGRFSVGSMDCTDPTIRAWILPDIQKMKYPCDQVAALFAIHRPLTIQCISDLLIGRGTDEGARSQLTQELVKIASLLQPLLCPGQPNIQATSIISPHQVCREFMTSQEEAGPYVISLQRGSDMLLGGIARELRSLSRDPLNVGLPCRPNHDEVILTRLRENGIGPMHTSGGNHSMQAFTDTCPSPEDTLRPSAIYACEFWIPHALAHGSNSNTSSKDEIVLPSSLLQCLLPSRFPIWLEWMSLLNKTQEVHRLLLQIVKAFENTNNAYLKEALLCFRSFAEPLAFCAASIYLNLRLYSPHSSQLAHENFGSSLSLPKSLSGSFGAWPTAEQVIALPCTTAVDMVSWYHDRYVAIAAGDQLYVYDLEDSRLLSQAHLGGRESVIKALCFSTSGTYVSAVAGTQVYCWNRLTSPPKPLEYSKLPAKANKIWPSLAGGAIGDTLPREFFLAVINPDRNLKIAIWEAQAHRPTITLRVADDIFSLPGATSHMLELTSTKRLRAAVAYSGAALLCFDLSLTANHENGHPHLYTLNASLLEAHQDVEEPNINTLFFDTDGKSLAVIYDCSDTVYIYTDSSLSAKISGASNVFRGLFSSRGIIEFPKTNPWLRLRLHSWLQPCPYTYLDIDLKDQSWHWPRYFNQTQSRLALAPRTDGQENASSYISIVDIESMCQDARSKNAFVSIPDDKVHDSSTDVCRMEAEGLYTDCLAPLNLDKGHPCTPPVSTMPSTLQEILRSMPSQVTRMFWTDHAHPKLTCVVQTSTGRSLFAEFNRDNGRRVSPGWKLFTEIQGVDSDSPDLVKSLKYTVCHEQAAATDDNGWLYWNDNQDSSSYPFIWVPRNRRGIYCLESGGLLYGPVPTIVPSGHEELSTLTVFDCAEYLRSTTPTENIPA